MPFSFLRSCGLVTVATVMAVVGFSVSRAPAIASSDPMCASVFACLEWVNAGTGPGLEGVAQSNVGGLNSVGVIGFVARRGYTGVLGSATSTDLAHPTYGVIGVSRNGIGVMANNNVALKPALYAENHSSADTAVAVQGVATGNAVVGRSTRGNGAVGQTSYSDTTGASATAGVLGQDLSTPNPEARNFTAGVGGTSVSGTGVVGVSGSFNPRFTSPVYIAGVQGSSFYPNNPGNFGALGLTTAIEPTTHNFNIEDGFGAYGTGVTGVEGVGADYVSTFSGTGTGVAGFGSIGVYADDQAGQLQSGGFGVGLWAEQDNNNGYSDVMVGAGPGGNKVMSLDTNGNMILAGTLTERGSPMVVQPTAGGSNLATYATRATSPAIEDFGEGTLVNGRGYVRLDSSFASAINRRETYLVFLTPLGMVRGTLCVMGKTADGFTVQESQGGRSTIAFDYRIVAKPFGDNAQRLGAPRLMRAIKIQFPKAYINRAAAGTRGFSARFKAGYIPTQR